MTIPIKLTNIAKITIYLTGSAKPKFHSTYPNSTSEHLYISKNRAATLNEWITQGE